MLFLGIDGGGTKTEFLLADENGRMQAKTLTGTIDILQTGDLGYEKIIRDGVEAVLGHRQSTDAIAYTCIGIPRLGELKAKEAVMTGVPQKIFGGRVYCANDVEIGWASSLACKNGINIVAGTGSIGYGKNNGSSMRAGGWAELFGDEGSAYWLGKKLLELFSKQSDGRLPRGPLYEIVKTDLKLAEDFDIIEYCEKLDRMQIAHLQLLLHKAAKQGDESAIWAYCAAAKELAIIAKAIKDGLNFRKDERVLLSYCGGLFHKESLLKPLFEAELAGLNLQFTEPVLDPVAGAALYAIIRGLGLSAEDTRLTKIIGWLKAK